MTFWEVQNKKKFKNWFRSANTRHPKEEISENGRKPVHSSRLYRQ